MQTPSWSQDDPSLASGPLPQSQSSAPHPPMPLDDQQHPNQESENPPDYNRGSSAGAISMSGSKSDTYRENHKQVKVLRSFPLFCSPLVPRVRLSLFPFFGCLSPPIHRAVPRLSVVCLTLRGVPTHPSPWDGFSQHADTNIPL
jgi:hypothetical protein